MLFESNTRAPVRSLILVAAAAAVALASPQFALAQTPDGGAGSGCALGPLCGIGDLGSWLQQTIQHILTDLPTGLVQDFGGAIVSFINDVNFLTHTPENLSYDNELVKQFATATQILADGLLGVVVLTSGYNIMLRPYVGATYAERSSSCRACCSVAS